MTYYYQKINDIGKEVALITSNTQITDSVHYREISKEYYRAVLELLREVAAAQEEGEPEE